MSRDPEPADPQVFADAVAAALAPHLPAELAAAQGRFCAALARAHARVNLTGVTDPEGMASRHILDSLLALQVLGEGTGSLVDLGSGGGVPGLPLALALPERPVVLIESRGRKAQALADIVTELDLGGRVTVVPRRAELWLAEETADTILTRAVGSVEAQLKLLAPLRDRFRRLVMFKGPAVDDELAQAAGRMTKGRWGDPRRIDAALPDEAGRRTLLVFEGGLGA